MIHRRTDPERFFFFFFFFMLLLLLLLLGSMRRCERRRETRVVLMSESRTKLGPSPCTFSPVCSFGFMNGTHDVNTTTGEECSDLYCSEQVQFKANVCPKHCGSF